MSENVAASRDGRDRASVRIRDAERLQRRFGKRSTGVEGQRVGHGNQVTKRPAGIVEADEGPQRDVLGRGDDVGWLDPAHRSGIGLEEERYVAERGNIRRGSLEIHDCIGTVGVVERRRHRDVASAGRRVGRERQRGRPRETGIVGDGSRGPDVGGDRRVAGPGQASDRTALGERAIACGTPRPTRARIDEPWSAIVDEGSPAELPLVGIALHVGGSAGLHERGASCLGARGIIRGR